MGARIHHRDQCDATLRSIADEMFSPDEMEEMLTDALEVSAGEKHMPEKLPVKVACMMACIWLTDYLLDKTKGEKNER